MEGSRRVRVLVRGGKPPHVAVTPEASLSRWTWGIFGGNVGNTLFWESAYRVVNTPTAHVQSDSLYVELLKEPDTVAAAINNDFDMYVLPLANAFRGRFIPSLSRLTEVIKRLDVPVVVPGVGGQSGLGEEMADPAVDDAVRDFVRAVLDRSASIGVRGEQTAAYLEGLGFPRSSIDIIGCPSLFNSPDLRISKRAKRIKPASPIAMNITPVAGIEPLIDYHVQRYSNLTYVAQEHLELAMLLWGIDAVPDRPGIPLNTGHPLYKQDRIRFFLDPHRWRQFMSSQDFAFGTRIHGTIAALAAGTPAVLLVHDSRTKELADYHCIPHREYGEDIVDAAGLYEEADFSEFNSFFPEAFGRYTDFLDRNGVEHVHKEGNENPAYVARIERTRLPEGVRTFAAEMTPFERELLRKLAHLRQGAEKDAERWIGGYMPAWRPK